jgi:hypothetical protein
LTFSVTNFFSIFSSNTSIELLKDDNIFNTDYAIMLIDWFSDVLDTMKQVLDKSGITGLELAVNRGNLSMIQSELKTVKDILTSKPVNVLAIHRIMTRITIRFRAFLDFLGYQGVDIYSVVRQIETG